MGFWKHERGPLPLNELWSGKHSTSGITLTFLSTLQVLSGKFLEQNLLSKITQIFLPRSFFHCSNCWLESYLFLFLRSVRCCLVSEELNETETLGPWSHLSLLSFLHWKILCHKELIVLDRRILELSWKGLLGDGYLNMVLVVWISLASVYFVKFLGKILENQKDL